MRIIVALLGRYKHMLIIIWRSLKYQSIWSWRERCRLVCYARNYVRLLSEQQEKGDALRSKERNPLHSNFDFYVFDLIFLNTEYKKKYSYGIILIFCPNLNWSILFYFMDMCLNVLYMRLPFSLFFPSLIFVLIFVKSW